MEILWPLLFYRIYDMRMFTFILHRAVRECRNRIETNTKVNYYNTFCKINRISTFAQIVYRYKTVHYMMHCYNA